jgi:pseudouridine synthase
VAVLGDRVDPRRDQVTVDGTPVPTHPELRYFAFNKPVGVTTTLRDPHARQSVVSYLPPGPRVFPVGRLDRETEGLLLLTNDGTLAHRLQHPRFGVDREYLVELAGPFTRSEANRMRKGVDLDDGVATPVQVAVSERVRHRTAVQVVMREGRKREVRRMFQALDHRVERLIRVRIGPVRLAGLRPGVVRPLEPEEVADLYRVAGLAVAQPRPRRPKEGERRARKARPRPEVERK